jgi:hypothetical protein
MGGSLSTACGASRRDEVGAARRLLDPSSSIPRTRSASTRTANARNNPIGRIDPSGYKDLAPYEPGTHFLDDLTRSLNKFGDDVRDNVKSVTRSATKALGDLHKGSASPTQGNPPKGTREHDRSDAPEDTWVRARRTP